MLYISVTTFCYYDHPIYQIYYIHIQISYLQELIGLLQQQYLHFHLTMQDSDQTLVSYDYETNYIVETIMSKKIINQKQYYLVKWRNYGINQSTWQPVQNLVTVQHLVDEFNKNITQKEKKIKAQKKRKSIKTKKTIIPEQLNIETTNELNVISHQKKQSNEKQRQNLDHAHNEWKNIEENLINTVNEQKLVQKSKDLDDKTKGIKKQIKNLIAISQCSPKKKQKKYEKAMKKEQQNANIVLGCIPKIEAKNSRTSQTTTKQQCIKLQMKPKIQSIYTGNLVELNIKNINAHALIDNQLYYQVEYYSDNDANTQTTLILNYLLFNGYSQHIIQYYQSKIKLTSKQVV